MTQLKKIFFIIVLLSASYSSAKELSITIKGTVFEQVNNINIPLSLANVHCEGTTEGVITSEFGDFKMDLKKGKYKIIFSFVGYENVCREFVIKRNNQKQKMHVEVVLKKENSNQLAIR